MNNKLNSIAKSGNFLYVLVKISQILIPVVILIFYFLSKRQDFKGPAVSFLFFVIAERIYETFYSSRAVSHLRYAKRDLLLEVLTVSYIVLLTIVSFDFFLLESVATIRMAAISSFLFFSALFFRWWAIKTLADRWSVLKGDCFSSGKGAKLIIAGPYRYVRHPIFLGFILEVIAIPLLFNSIYGLLFSIFIFFPLIGFRAIQDEESLISEFGNDYLQYRENIPAFLPFRRLKNFE